MQNITSCFILCFLVIVSDTFFIQSRDLKRMLRLFPKAFEVETPQKTHPSKHRPNNYYRDEYYHDEYDRHDSGESSRNPARNSQNRYVRIYDKKPHFLSEQCNHPDHHHERQFKDILDKHNHRRYKYEDEEETNYNEQKNEKNKNMQLHSGKEDEDAKVEKFNNFSHKNRDYVTGVLVTIPKIKNDQDLDNYYRENKRENTFLQHLLKTESDDQRSHHHILDDSKSYVY